MRLAILGASGHGKVVADCAELIGWDSITFFDDRFPFPDKEYPWLVAGNSGALIADLDQFDGVVVAIGDNKMRARWQDRLVASGAKLATLIHPRAYVSSHSAVGPGTVVLPNACVNAFAAIGAGVIVNSGAVVEHDCVVGDFVHLSPGSILAGGVRVGPLAWIGAGAMIKQMRSIGNACKVGMGAVVVTDVAPEHTVVGNPAKAKG